MEQVENVSDGLMAYPGNLIDNDKAYNAISLSMAKLVLLFSTL